MRAPCTGSVTWPCVAQDKAANLDKAAQTVATAASAPHNADVVVLPECFNSPYATGRYGPCACVGVGVDVGARSIASRAHESRHSACARVPACAPCDGVCTGRSFPEYAEVIPSSADDVDAATQPSTAMLVAAAKDNGVWLIGGACSVCVCVCVPLWLMGAIGVVGSDAHVAFASVVGRAWQRVAVLACRCRPPRFPPTHGQVASLSATRLACTTPAWW